MEEEGGRGDTDVAVSAGESAKPRNVAALKTEEGAGAEECRQLLEDVKCKEGRQP